MKMGFVTVLSSDKVQLNMKKYGPMIWWLMDLWPMVVILKAFGKSSQWLSGLKIMMINVSY